MAEQDDEYNAANSRKHRCGTDVGGGEFCDEPRPCRFHDTGLPCDTQGHQPDSSEGGDTCIDCGLAIVTDDGGNTWELARAARLLLDTSEPDWWMNGEQMPDDWTATGSLMLGGPDGGWVHLDLTFASLPEMKEAIAVSPSTHEQESPPLSAQFQAEIDGLLKAQGMTRSDLARALGVHRSQVTQTLGGNPTLATVQRFGEVLGVHYGLVRLPVKCATAGTYDPAEIVVYGEGSGDGDGGLDRA